MSYTHYDEICQDDMFFENNSPREISSSFPKTPDVVITNGGDPIKWCINGFEGKSNVDYSGEIIDTTGAGDAFLAGLISQMFYFNEPISELDIQKAIKFACACGFLTCQSEGAIEPQPVYNRVHEFIYF